MPRAAVSGGGKTPPKKVPTPPTPNAAAAAGKGTGTATLVSKNVSTTPDVGTPKNESPTLVKANSGPSPVGAVNYANSHPNSKVATNLASADTGGKWTQGATGKWAQGATGKWQQGATGQWAGGSTSGGGASGGGGGGSRTGGTTQTNRTGGGFPDVHDTRPVATFDNHPDTTFGGGGTGGTFSGGGGGGGGATNPLSGNSLSNSDISQLLGAKKGRRQRSRRGTE